MRPVLIDTCIWVPFFNRPQSAEKKAVDALLDDDLAVLIGPIVTEILQGIPREAQANYVGSLLRGMRWLETIWEDWIEAARLGRRLAAAGHRLPPVRSSLPWREFRRQHECGSDRAKHRRLHRRKAKPGALAWLLGKGDFIVPIPGTKRRKYLEENAGAVDVKLSDDDMARLEAALRPEAVSGPRYNEKLMAWVDR